MNGHRQSDRPVVPASPPNKAMAAEAGEERERAKGNTASKSRPGRSAGSGVSSALDRVRQVAARDREARFTALLQHVTVDQLGAAYWAISPKAAPGVDQVRWASYGRGLEANLQDLYQRVQAGRVTGRRRVGGSTSRRRTGRQRPLGIATLEDKIVQRAVACGVELDLRGGLPGLLRRVPAGAQPA
jgi:RNA-directed DNA polymerase